MLLKLYEENATIDSLQESLQNALNEYKEKYQQQVEKDIGGIVERGRDAILLKDPAGGSKVIDMMELQKLPTLTGEQKDFIKTIWHQGTFGSGWFAISCFTEDLLGQISTNYVKQEEVHVGHIKFASNNFLVVDISTPSEVRLYNQCHTQIRQELTNDSNSLIDFATGILEVDISNLKSETFIPGCASGQPIIDIYISAFDPKIELKFPQDVVIESLEFDQKRQELIPDTIKSCLQEIGIKGTQRVKAINLLTTLKGKEQAEKLVFRTLIPEQHSQVVQQLISIKDSSNAAELMFSIIVTSDLSNKEKEHLLEAICIMRDENFFTDSITTVAAELMAKAKSQEVVNKTREEGKLSEQYIKFLEFISAAKNSFDKSGSSQQDNPLEAIAVKISQVQKSQEAHIVEQCEGLEQTLAVKNYVALEPNQEKQEKFANKQLAKYCQGQTVKTLNESATNRISSALISILIPICKNDQERKALKNNADLVVRECARYGGVEMSFGQKWHAYIIDPIKKLLGRTQEMPKFLKEHPELTGILTAHMHPNKLATDPVGSGEHASNPVIPHKSAHKGNSRRG